MYALKCRLFYISNFNSIAHYNIPKPYPLPITQALCHGPLPWPHTYVVVSYRGRALLCPTLPTMPPLSPYQAPLPAPHQVNQNKLLNTVVYRLINNGLSFWLTT